MKRTERLLKGEYPLPPDAEATLRNHWLKAIGACVLMLAFYLAAVSAIGARTGEGSAIFLDVVFVLAILMTLGSYSRGYASLRVSLARARKDPKERIALLVPFVGKRARFDPRGEAFTLLREAAEQCGERELARLCREQLARLGEPPGPG